MAAPAPFRGGGVTRTNPLSDRFAAHAFDHVEFWCGDAGCARRRFGVGLGMQLVAKSDQSTGNQAYASYVCRSNELVFVFTAPYGVSSSDKPQETPHPGFSQATAHAFHTAHGLAVRAVGLRVEDARAAHEAAVSGGGISALAPTLLQDGSTWLAEVVLYGDVHLRFLSRAEDSSLFLPGYVPVEGATPERCFGLKRLDHCVGNVADLRAAADYLTGLTGFHEFAEFVSEDVGTLESGLNSLVLASNNERVLLPINEPVHGTARRSQIQTYLEQHGGAGVQHLALFTDDIFSTLRQMVAAEREGGGFELLRSASEGYYDRLPEKVGTDLLTPEQFAACRELGVLVDRDDRGLLLQIFTKPVGDRPTLFLEVIQRLGCPMEGGKEAGVAALPPFGTPYEQAGGCGGFGKGNFSELFRSIEAHESSLGLNEMRS